MQTASIQTVARSSPSLNLGLTGFASHRPRSAWSLRSLAYFVLGCECESRHSPSSLRLRLSSGPEEARSFATSILKPGRGSNVTCLFARLGRQYLEGGP